MAVMHYKKDGKILCGTKAKTFKSTNDRKLVTCKRCLKKLKDVTINVIQTKTHIILTIKRIQFMFPLDKKIELFMMSTPDGTVFTSPLLCGTQIKRVVVERDRKVLSNVLQTLKMENKGLYAKNIYDHFKI